MSPPSHQPVIGVTLDYETAGGYSKFPWYAVRENYMDAVTFAGGLPVALPHSDQNISQYMDMIDGLLVTGGAFDVDPQLFGAARTNTVTVTKTQRTRFELSAVGIALERDIPLLGICGGEQLINVALGGSLIQDISHDVAGSLQHEQVAPRNEPGHSVNIISKTLLHSIVGQSTIEVNSAHHQAVANIGTSCVVNALAPDGIIEGIEELNHRFCLGIQWHPEFHISSGDRKIFEACVNACNQ